MNADAEAHNSVNRQALRELLTKSFNYEELKDLCFDHYPDLYDNLGSNFGKNVIARQLIAYCERHGLIEHLVALIKTHNPYQYEIYAERITEPSVPPPISADEPAVTLKLVFPDLKVEDFTPDKRAALIDLIAEELNIPRESIEILEIRTGSVIIILRLPGAAADRLIALLQAGHPVIQDLRLGAVKALSLRDWWRLKISRFLARLANVVKLPLVLTFTLGIVVGLVTSSLRPVLSEETSVFRPPTNRSGLVFVTPTPIPSLTLSATSPLLAGGGNEINLPATPVAAGTILVSETAAKTSTPASEQIPPASLLTVPSALHQPDFPASTFLPPEPTETLTPGLVETSPSPGPAPFETVIPVSTRPPQSGQTLITLDGPKEVKVSQVFTVAVGVKITGPPGVFGAQFKLNYPPAYLKVVEIIPNPELLVAVQSVDSRQGQVAFAASRYKNVPNFTGEVVFAWIRFRTEPAERETDLPLTLQDVKLGSKGGAMVTTSSQNLFLTIRK